MSKKHLHHRGGGGGDQTAAGGDAARSAAAAAAAAAGSGRPPGSTSPPPSSSQQQQHHGKRGARLERQQRRQQRGSGGLLSLLRLPKRLRPVALAGAVVLLALYLNLVFPGLLPAAKAWAARRLAPLPSAPAARDGERLLGPSFGIFPRGCRWREVTYANDSARRVRLLRAGGGWLPAAAHWPAAGAPGLPAACRSPQLPPLFAPHL